MRSIGDQTWWIGAAVIVAAAGSFCIYAIDPIISFRFPLCLFHFLTGLHCPGCGCLRATQALVHGRFADALTFNSLFVVGVPLAAGAWIWNRSRSQPIELRPIWAWWLIGVVLVFGVARNVPLYPFSALAPHAWNASSTQK